MKIFTVITLLFAAVISLGTCTTVSSSYAADAVSGKITVQDAAGTAATLKKVSESAATVTSENTFTSKAGETLTFTNYSDGSHQLIFTDSEGNETTQDLADGTSVGIDGSYWQSDSSGNAVVGYASTGTGNTAASSAIYGIDSTTLRTSTPGYTYSASTPANSVGSIINGAAYAAPTTNTSYITNAVTEGWTLSPYTSDTGIETGSTTSDTGGWTIVPYIGNAGWQAVPYTGTTGIEIGSTTSDAGGWTIAPYTGTTGIEIGSTTSDAEGWTAGIVHR